MQYVVEAMLSGRKVDYLRSGDVWIAAFSSAEVVQDVTGRYVRWRLDVEKQRMRCMAPLYACWNIKQTSHAGRGESLILEVKLSLSDG